MTFRICSKQQGHFNFRNVEYLTVCRNDRADLILLLFKIVLDSAYDAIHNLWRIPLALELFS